MSFCERLAEYFKARPNVWINGFELMKVGGSFAYRTRISELRHAPYLMRVENRVTRHKRTEPDTIVKHWTTTEYRYVPPVAAKQPTLFDEAHA